MEFVIKRKDNDELNHHGIDGMHWGERRYQYEDGHYTPEGKKRYAQRNKSQRKMIEEIGDEGAKNSRSETAKEASSVGNKVVDSANAVAAGAAASKIGNSSAFVAENRPSLPSENAVNSGAKAGAATSGGIGGGASSPTDIRPQDEQEDKEKKTKEPKDADDLLHDWLPESFKNLDEESQEEVADFFSKYTNTFTSEPKSSPSSINTTKYTKTRTIEPKSAAAVSKTSSYNTKSGSKKESKNRSDMMN